MTHTFHPFHPFWMELKQRPVFSERLQNIVTSPQILWCKCISIFSLETLRRSNLSKSYIRLCLYIILILICREPQMTQWNGLIRNAAREVGIINRLMWLCYEALDVADHHGNGRIRETKCSMSAIIFRTLHRHVPSLNISSFSGYSEISLLQNVNLSILHPEVIEGAF
jgi:hypothetical protein